MSFIIILLFVLGLIFGSFFTKVGYRVPVNEEIFSKSKCTSCSNELSLKEKIPLISYFIQKGKCIHCHQKISLIYPFFELMCSLMFPLIYIIYMDASNPFINTLFGLVFASSLIIVMITDIKYMIIPDEILLFSSVLVIIFKLVLGYQNEEILSLLDAGYELIFMFLDAIVMFVIMYIIKKIGDYLFKKESLGGGDVKLMAYIALVIGYKMGIVVIFLASFIALPLSIINAYKKNEQMLPFGPYLAIATLILFLLGINFDTLLEFIH